MNYTSLLISLKEANTKLNLILISNKLLKNKQISYYLLVINHMNRSNKNFTIIKY